MSNSLKSIEQNDDSQSKASDDEPLDPRIQIELEHANAATSEINNLETQLNNAQKIFQLSFNNYKQCLAKLAKNNSRSIERARPYYDACQKATEAQHDTQHATHEYQDSVEFFHTTQDSLRLAQQHSQTDVDTWKEYIDQATIKLNKAEQDKRKCEQLHEETSKRYQEYEQKRILLSRSLKQSISKSKSYFEIKRHAEIDLKNQKVRIEDFQKAIRQAKSAYRTALNRLEEISEEIHRKRSKDDVIDLLQKREATIGIERIIELETFDFPNENLSDNDSDRDLSSPIHSLSINDLSSRSSKERSIVTTNSVPQSLTNLVPENSIAFLLTDSSNSRPSNNENESIQSTSIDQEQQRSINQSKRIGKNLTVQLLADRTRMHPSSSDSSLNVIPNF